jgi:hypothetical protein
MDELYEMVEKILRRFRRPYPENIIDQVFLAIEKDENLLREYHYLADDDYATTNQQIGKHVADITRLRSDNRQCGNPESKLIKSFSYLVNR